MYNKNSNNKKKLLFNKALFIGFIIGISPAFVILSIANILKLNLNIFVYATIILAIINGFYLKSKMIKKEKNTLD